MISAAFVVAFTCFFFHACTWEGMIGQRIPELFWDAPSWIKKPVYDCPTCMCPWWGIIILPFSDFQPANIVQIIIVLSMAGGINSLLDCFIKYLGIGKGKDD